MEIGKPSISDYVVPRLPIGVILIWRQTVLVSRRNFLKSSAVLLPTFALLPMVFRRAVASSVMESGGQTSPYPERTLVILQMAGGNDGLNTVIPFTDSRYYDHRSYLAVPESDVLDLNGEFGLHSVLDKII